MRGFPLFFPVTCHTDFVTSGSTFVAINGMKRNGADYVLSALQKGATQIVVEFDQVVDEQAIKKYGARIVRVHNTRKALAQLSAQAADYPTKKLKIIGITGTKGKTTTTHILYHLLQSLGYKVACLNTVYNMINDVTFKAPLTTAQPDYLHQFFKLCVQEGVEYVVMEVAAQAFTFDRVHEIEFDAALFTNLDQEHGELYATQEEYFKEKAKLFVQIKEGAPALVNTDDAHGKMLLTMHDGFKSYSVNDDEADYQAQFSTKEYNRYSCTFSYQGKDASFVYSTFPGQYNGYNILAAVTTLLELGISLDSLRSGLRSLPPLSGRLEEYLLPNGARALIDYAHTPASFAAVFQMAREWTKDLIVVFGAGGGKDQEKRPLMGSIAAQWADKVILTSDNPRFEEVSSIIQNIKEGISKEHLLKVTVELERKKAIEQAYFFSKRGSVIMILGKGPDEHEIVKDQVIPFNEKSILLSLI